ncbi:MAG: relaxase/mobilization nuclease domain-containing protein [Oscillospiraceae bacterium]
MPPPGRRCGRCRSNSARPREWWPCTPTQSFKPGEVTPEQCHAIGVELARRVWGGRFQVLVATHLNTDCLHNHFVINAVSYVDGKKYEQRRDQYRRCAGFPTNCAGNTPCRSSSSPAAKPRPPYEGERARPGAEAMRRAIHKALFRPAPSGLFARCCGQWVSLAAGGRARKYATLRSRTAAGRCGCTGWGRNTTGLRSERALANNHLGYGPHC